MRQITKHNGTLETVQKPSFAVKRYLELPLKKGTCNKSCICSRFAVRRDAMCPEAIICKYLLDIQPESELGEQIEEPVEEIGNDEMND